MAQQVSIEKVKDVILAGSENADDDSVARVANLRANYWEVNLEKVNQSIEEMKEKIEGIQPK